MFQTMFSSEDRKDYQGIRNLSIQLQALLCQFCFIFWYIYGLDCLWDLSAWTWLAQSDLVLMKIYKIWHQITFLFFNLIFILETLKILSYIYIIQIFSWSFFFFLLLLFCLLGGSGCLFVCLFFGQGWQGEGKRGQTS